MTGRKEHALRAKEVMERKLKNCPPCVGRFYASMPNMSHNTKKVYIDNLMQFLNDVQATTDEEIYRLDTNDVNAYCSKRALEISEASRLREITVLKMFFTFLQESGCIALNPVSSKVRKGIKAQATETVVMTRSEVRRCFQKIQEHGGKWMFRDLLIFALPLATGLRLSELNEINVQDIDFDKKRLNIIGKGNKHAHIALTDEIIEYINNWEEKRAELLAGQQLDALFVSYYGGTYNRMSIPTMERVVQRYTEFLGKKIRPHKLRSTFCTEAYRDCQDIYTVASLMRHESIQTTQRYIANDKAKENETIINISEKLLPSA